MNKFTLILFFTFSFLGIKAQESFKENTYDSKSNPLYWKNKMPFPGYWQQDVHYLIDAIVDEKTSIITGKEKLIYTNNSLDDLDRVYFHLYTNALTKTPIWIRFIKNII